MDGAALVDRRALTNTGDVGQVIPFREDANRS
jgi:hypothetical protein